MPAPKGFKTVKKLMKRGQARKVCARKSYGMTPERKGTRVLVCCPRGSWDDQRKKCRSSTKAVEVFKRKG